MNEENRKKREWVKSAAIVFLSVMLVLTFFSNTIMNYSLPEVATQYITSGTITAKIRGTGTVESGDPYLVEVKESRKVSSVEVRVGSTVQKGDILMVLEDTESQELKDALAQLNSLKDAYDSALLKISDATLLKNMQNGKFTSQDSFSKKTQKLLKEIEELEEKVDEAQTWLDALNSQIAMSGVTYSTATQEKALADAKATLLKEETVNKPAAVTALTNAQNNLTTKTDALTVAEAEKASAQTDVDTKTLAVTDAQTAVNTAQTNYDNAVAGGVQGDIDAAADVLSAAQITLVEKQNELATAQSVLNTATTKVTTATNEKTAAETAVTTAQLNVDKCDENIATYTNLVAVRENELEVARLQVESANANASATVNNLRNQVATAQYNLSVHQSNLAEKQEEYTNLMTQIDTENSIRTQVDAINAQQVVVDEIVAQTQGATVTADVAGRVTAINVSSGQKTDPTTPVVVIQPAGKGFTLSFSVTNEQAKRVSVGDPAELYNSWWYDDITAKLVSIRPDTSDPMKKKLLTFELEGDLTDGQNLSLSVGQKSSNYDMIVPNSAIREDNNGKFILIVEQSSSPLGNRYKAVRADIQVVASDETQSAITGAIYGWEPVITTSTKPVEEGQLVRLPD